jgi:hypothetical protein
MMTSFFFFIKGYSLNIPTDSPDFAVSIVENAAKEGTIVQDEIGRIAAWLKPQVTTPRLKWWPYRLIRDSLPKDAGTDALFQHRAWNRYYGLWHTETTRRFKVLLKRWPGVRTHRVSLDPTR